MNVSEMIEVLNGRKGSQLLEVLYGKEQIEENKRRYLSVMEGFQKHFQGEDICLFTSPGRTEISGNHTDHNHGMVLAGSINLDCVAAASRNNTNQVRIISETYSQDMMVCLDDLEPEEKSGTLDLVKGLLKGCQELGYEIGGFNAYVTSNVIGAAGVSSSASFEMLLCSMVNKFFNGGTMDSVAYAHIGKYAENHYWDKASGLLDQMACAVGGLITIDFKDPFKPVVKKLDFDFASQNHSLIIVNTGKGHADLSEDYSFVPSEMKKVAQYFGKEVCAEITEEQVLEQMQAVREFAGDRSVLRALHFFEENQRVLDQVEALKNKDFDGFLKGITASGNSSWKWLQNCYTNSNYQEQGITIALAVTELYLAKKKVGACRVHGGGFAGVIMTILPNELVGEYMSEMEQVLGEGNAYKMSIRPYGAVCINELLMV